MSILDAYDSKQHYEANRVHQISFNNLAILMAGFGAGLLKKKPLHLMVPYCVKFGPSMSNGMTVHRGYKSSNPVASSTRVECSESNQLVWVPYSSNFKNFIQIRQQFSEVILHISKWKITMSKCSAVLQELELRYLVSRNEKDVTVTLIGFC